MVSQRPPEDLARELRRSRRTLERQIEEGHASCNVQDALDRIAKIHKDEDAADDSLLQRGKA